MVAGRRRAAALSRRLIRPGGLDGLLRSLGGPGRPGRPGRGLTEVTRVLRKGASIVLADLCATWLWPTTVGRRRRAYPGPAGPIAHRRRAHGPGTGAASADSDHYRRSGPLSPRGTPAVEPPERVAEGPTPPRQGGHRIRPASQPAAPGWRREPRQPGAVPHTARSRTARRRESNRHTGRPPSAAASGVRSQDPRQTPDPARMSAR